MSRRPRFSLKRLFGLMTILALAIGYWSARQRAIAAMGELHNSVIQQINANLNIAPPGTTFVPGRRPVFGGPPIQALGDRLSSASWSTRSLNTAGHAATSPKDLAAAIAQHYGVGLADLGFSSTMSTTGNTEATVLHMARGNDLTVLFDVRVDPAAQTATVRIVFTESQTAEIW